MKNYFKENSKDLLNATFWRKNADFSKTWGLKNIHMILVFFLSRGCVWRFFHVKAKIFILEDERDGLPTQYLDWQIVHLTYDVPLALCIGDVRPLASRSAGITDEWWAEKWLTSRCPGEALSRAMVPGCIKGISAVEMPWSKL